VNTAGALSDNLATPSLNNLLPAWWAAFTQCSDPNATLCNIVNGFETQGCITMLVHHFLEMSARRLPHKTALVFEDSRLTYAEIDHMANQCAQALLAGGVKRGDRVALFADNSVELVVAIFGALKANAVFCVINGSTKTDKLAFMLQNARPTALVTQANKLPVADPACRQAPSLQQLYVVGDATAQVAHLSVQPWNETLAAQPSTPPPTTNISVDLATIIYTSGSTGTPKGVMSSHQNIVAASTSIIEYLENVEDDVILNVLPLAFDYGLYQLLMAFKVGATLVLERGFAFPRHVLHLMHREGVTGLPGVPTVFSLLLGLKNMDQLAPPTLRYISNTAAALPVSHVLELRDAFPNAKLFSMYGLTECKRVSYLSPSELDRRPGSVGKAIPNTETFIVGDDDQPLPPGEVGELVVRGAHVMQGYWEAPEATAKRFRSVPQPNGLPGPTLLYTGDLFRTDAEGYLYFIGRKDDIIKCRGEKVAPKEIEHVLYAFEGVQDAAAVGIPDLILGQAIKVFVAPRPGVALDTRALREHCKRNLEDFMVPSIIEIRDALPKGGTGKIDKQALLAETRAERDTVTR
jgi:amino acid adenylation domain-containing protein